MELNRTDVDLDVLSRPLFEMELTSRVLEAGVRFDPIDHAALARLALSEESFEGLPINLAESQEKYRLREELRDKLAVYSRRKQVAALHAELPSKSSRLHGRGGNHIRQRKQRIVETT
ncbi:MAG TPA: hypothetical protein VIH90_02985 [Candidatus Saccharimonadales bacterium]